MNDEIKIIDLSECEFSIKNGLYGGQAGAKEGIAYKGENWLVKYPKSTKSMECVERSYTNSPVCEYLGSHVYEILGFDTHETLLGFRNEKVVVACKDFETDSLRLAELRTIVNYQNQYLADAIGEDIGEPSNMHHVNLKNLMLHIRHNPILLAVDGVEERFFEQAVVDIYINNSDRNNGNWGILRNSKGRDLLAPVFDNGGSFQDKLSDEKAYRILQNPEAARTNACGTQTIYGDETGSLYSVKRFLGLTEEYPKLEAALVKVVPLLIERQDDIKQMIYSLPEYYLDSKTGVSYGVCENSIKELFILQLQTRLDKLLIPAYEKVKEKKDNIDAPCHIPKRGR